MTNFNFEKTNLDGLLLITPFIHPDNRGYFLKSYEKNIYQENGINIDVSEINESKSSKGVLRGLHFQELYPQAKLLRVEFGLIYDVAVDIRKASPTYGKWQGFYLSEENKKQLYIPKGFAHGFITLSNDAVITYVCEGKYVPEYDSGIIWNDKDINVQWPIDNIILSDKDKRLQSFKEYNNRNV